jgi:psiF repeat-containing protein
MRTLALTAVLPLLFVAVPASAATKEQKMETCKVGADVDNLEGNARDAFMKKCMGARNYEPAARRDAMKKGKKTANKKPTDKPAAAPADAPEQ